MEFSSTAVGPGLLETDLVAPRPMLEGFSGSNYADLYNPLPMDFVAIFASSKPVNAPAVIKASGQGVQTKNESSLEQNYGLGGFRNENYNSKIHVKHQAVIKAGETKRFFGDNAQVIVRQLVNEIIQRRGNSIKLGDLFHRNIIEKEVIKQRGEVDMSGNFTPFDTAKNEEFTPYKELEIPKGVENGETEFPTKRTKKPVTDVSSTI